MKKVAFVLVFLVVLIASALAQKGMFFEYEIKLEDPKMPAEIAKTYGLQTIRSWFQEDWFRMDAANGANSIIIRKDKGVVWIIDNAAKKYMEFPLSTFEEMMKKAEEQAKSFKFEYRKTGRTKSIGRWSCFEVEVEAKNPQDLQIQPRSFMWITKSKELDPKKLEETFKWDMWGQFRFNKRAVDQPELEGFPVQIITEVSIPEGVVKTAMTLKNFENKQFPTSIFDLPTGYLKIEMPKMPPAGKNPSGNAPQQGN